MHQILSGCHSWARNEDSFNNYSYQVSGSLSAAALTLFLLLCFAVPCHLQLFFGSMMNHEYSRYRYHHALPQVIQGKEQEIPCTSEGLDFAFELQKGQPCLKCECDENDLRAGPYGTVSCHYVKNTCPNVDTCPVIQANRENKCCDKCLGCSYLSTYYEHEDVWPSSQDSCRRLVCKGGVVTMSRIQCVAKCTSPIRKVGYCCPVCQKDENVEGSQSVAAADPCVACDCTEGVCHCYKMACPVLDCEPSEQYLPEKKCCKECKKYKVETISESGCFFRNKQYRHQQMERLDPCTVCRCEDGHFVCQRFVCPEISCPAHRLYYESDLCCPRCRDQDPLPCLFEGTNYSHSEVWSPDLCTNCSCSHGEVKCSRLQCPHPYGCPKGYKPKSIPGQCCSICVEKEASCTVFGDPHYETFDGKTYNFQGSCKYVLAKHCVEPDGQILPFSVIVQNHPRGTTKYAWTKRVTVRLPQKVRISLLPKKRVRVNGKRLKKLPYVKLGSFSIMKDRQHNVVLRVLKNKISVVWDGNSFVELSLHPEYKNSVCGLCGNYNHDSSDDMLTPLGFTAASTFAFGQSWKTGGRKFCGLAKDRRWLAKQPSPKALWRKWTQKYLNSLESEQGGLNIGMSQTPGSGSILVLPPLQGYLKTKPKTIRKKIRRRCNWDKKAYALSQCKLLKGPIFGSCNSKVPVARFYKSCKTDICECPSTGRCYCESLLAYARACEKEGIFVAWFNQTNCLSTKKVCSSPLGSVFTTCAPLCTPSCKKPFPTESLCSNANCYPGCKCPQGTVLEGNTCIPINRCP